MPGMGPELQRAWGSSPASPLGQACSSTRQRTSSEGPRAGVAFMQVPSLLHMVQNVKNVPDCGTKEVAEVVQATSAAGIWKLRELS